MLWPSFLCQTDMMDSRTRTWFGSLAVGKKQLFHPLWNPEIPRNLMRSESHSVVISSHLLWQKLWQHKVSTSMGINGCCAWFNSFLMVVDAVVLLRPWITAVYWKTHSVHTAILMFIRSTLLRWESWNCLSITGLWDGKFHEINNYTNLKGNRCSQIPERKLLYWKQTHRRNRFRLTSQGVCHQHQVKCHAGMRITHL